MTQRKKIEYNAEGGYYDVRDWQDVFEDDPILHNIVKGLYAENDEVRVCLPHNYGTEFTLESFKLGERTAVVRLWRPMS
jgi:hypothetical protein